MIAAKDDVTLDIVKNINMIFLKNRTCLLSFIFISLISVICLGAEKIPDELKGIGINDTTGKKIDLNLTFKDETGKELPLQNYFSKGKPVLFFLVYYECPNLCTFVLNGAVDALKGIDKSPGKDFEIVALSFDPRETAELSVPKKAAYLTTFNRHDSDYGWHFLTGSTKNISQIASQLGFNYKWDEEQKQFAHASAFYVLTGDGIVSRIFYGISYAPQDVKFSIIEASKGHLSSILDKIILFCYHYDASTKKYVLLATRIMTAGGALTLIIMTFIFGSFWIRERKNKLMRRESK
jgi:protein SCO1/2